MPTIAERVCARLINGESLDQIGQDTSRSSLARGVQRYLAWALDAVPQVQAQLHQLREEVRTTDQALQVGQRERTGLIHDVEQRNRELQELATRCNDAEADLARVNAEREVAIAALCTVQDQIHALETRGFTEDLITQLAASDAASGGVLLRRVETLERYTAEIRTVQDRRRAVGDELDQTTTALRRRTEEFRDAETQVQRAQQTLLKFQDDTRQHRAAIQVIRNLTTRYGFTTRDFTALVRLLSAVGVEGMPGQTLDAVKDLLDAYRDYTGLTAAIDGKRHALTEVEAQHRKMEQRFELMQLTTTRIRRQQRDFARSFTRFVRDTGDALVQRLTQVQETALQAFTQSTEEAHRVIDDTTEAALQSLRAVQATGEDQVLQAAMQAQTFFTTVRDEREAERRQFHHVVERWGEMQAEAGQYTTEIQRASVLLALELDPEALELIGKDEVVLLLTRLSQWVQRQPWETNPTITVGRHSFSVYTVLSNCAALLTRSTRGTR